MKTDKIISNIANKSQLVTFGELLKTGKPLRFLYLMRFTDHNRWFFLNHNKLFNGGNENQYWLIDMVLKRTVNKNNGDIYFAA